MRFVVFVDGRFCQALICSLTASVPRTHTVEILIIQLGEDGALDLVGLHRHPVEYRQAVLGLDLLLYGHSLRQIKSQTIIIKVKGGDEH